MRKHNTTNERCTYPADGRDGPCLGTLVSTGATAGCLAHANNVDRDAYLHTLRPGSDLDHARTPFTTDLLRLLLSRVVDRTNRPVLGRADFHKAVFTGEASFRNTTFTGKAIFNQARFEDRAAFNGSTFAANAQFCGAGFERDAEFRMATFCDGVEFKRAHFGNYARFNGACFKAPVTPGPFVCREALVLGGARFEEPVTLDVAARVVSCRRTAWRSRAILRLRFADVVLEDAVLGQPVVVTTHHSPFNDPDAPASPVEHQDLGPDAGVRVLTVRGVDASQLRLSNVDLSSCVFTGANHLDQITLEGSCGFAESPRTVHRHWAVVPVWWTCRDTLVEEHHWRRRQLTERRSARADDWGTQEGDRHVGPDALANTYRQLRKAFEDARNEPGAADFYYGEMEMRRHATRRAGAEKALLWSYWLLSGYGLRATRAVVALAIAAACAVGALALWGLPFQVPSPRTDGTVHDGRIAVVTTTDTPGSVTGPLGERLSGERLVAASRTVVNSIAFRSSGQNLTTTGVYVEMGTRLLGPFLLALALLAVRGRVKR